MKFSEAWRALTGACVVYVAMAACSAAESGSTHGSGGKVGIGGSGGTTAEASDDGPLDVVADYVADVFDAASDPVSEAEAGPSPITVTANCDKVWDYQPGYKMMYAEAAFPGKPKEDLTQVRFMRGATASESMPPNYQHVSGTVPYVRDGFVALSCGFDTAGPFGPVTFILG